MLYLHIRSLFYCIYTYCTISFYLYLHINICLFVLAISIVVFLEQPLPATGTWHRTRCSASRLIPTPKECSPQEMVSSSIYLSISLPLSFSHSNQFVSCTHNLSRGTLRPKEWLSSTWQGIWQVHQHHQRHHWPKQCNPKPSKFSHFVTFTYAYLLDLL